MLKAIFSRIASPPRPVDECTSNQTAPFFGHRQVTDRNSPPTLGAVFFRDNFWDGRASNVFNGNDPFGQTGNGSGALAIGNASLASQAVGPRSTMSRCPAPAGRSTVPTALAPSCSRSSRGASSGSAPPTGSSAAWPAARGNGLNATYRDLITTAFGSTLGHDAQNQFSRVFGQAVQAYEATLIPDQTPFDRFLAGDGSAMTSKQRRVFDVFRDNGKCARCHAGPELSDATVSFAALKGLRNEDGGDQDLHNLWRAADQRRPGSRRPRAQRGTLLPGRLLQGITAPPRPPACAT
ncbi:MAG: hypothetical protein H0X69_08110 [Gemmatimonadales bacterium]|nr:hypothetical protein [Gemmatimonadales bacterium]